MSNTDEIVKIEIVLKRDGTMVTKAWMEEVVAAARPTMFQGLLHRASMAVYASEVKQP